MSIKGEPEANITEDSKDISTKNNETEKNSSLGNQSDVNAVKGEDLHNKLEEVKNNLLLAHAENENLRKRMQRQIDEAHKFAISNFAKDMIGTLDDLYRAINILESQKSSHDGFHTLFKGIELTKVNFEKNLEKYGIKRIFPKGEKFDYKFHDALSQVPSEEVREKTVIEVVQAGYSIKDKMLKHAQVIVAIPKE